MELFEILQIVFWTILVTCLFRMSRFNMYEARTFWGGTQFRPSPRSKGSSCWTSSADVLDSNEVPECPCPMIRDLGSINFSLQNPHRNTKFWHVCGSRFQRPKKHHQKPKKNLLLLSHKIFVPRSPVWAPQTQIGIISFAQSRKLWPYHSYPYDLPIVFASLHWNSSFQAYKFILPNCCRKLARMLWCCRCQVDLREQSGYWSNFTTRTILVSLVNVSVEFPHLCMFFSSRFPGLSNIVSMWVSLGF